ncbi:MAG: tRNA (adenosine(37)-N6)-threonylcarbamoyltransferase complex ATPase subunit type 1 TsaE [Clostridia bacterium]|nr:tRNA (adenosine(37)-N6)-threonylcarbamoyltransferase complex ATPase subunit type 1 TsaE [Clostridia bacterium]
MIKVLSNSAKDTEKIASDFAKNLRGKEVIALYGGLGAGKTCFTKGLSKGLSIKSDEVISPTFTLLNEYSGKYRVYHFDMYRINSFDELYSLGFFDFIGAGVIIVEWSENISKFLPDGTIMIHIEHGEKENERIISIECDGEEKYENISC